MITVRQAMKRELDEIVQFCNESIDSVQNITLKENYGSSIYPMEQFLLTCIENETLYIGLKGPEIVGTMILDLNFTDNCQIVKWNPDANKDVIVIHALGISSPSQGKKVAKQMVVEAIDICNKSENQIKAFHLDRFREDTISEKKDHLKEFVFIDMVKLCDQEASLPDSNLYEFII